MATKTLYVAKDMRDPIYRTRMLKAGEPLSLDGPTARLYLHLGLVTDRKPRQAQVEAAARDLPAAQVVASTPKPKRRRRKK